ncbi:MAG: TatD family hydrolase [Candidatus Omnitrophota bacterium]
MKKRPSLWNEFVNDGKVETCPVYDMHGHMGPFYGAYLPFADTESMAVRMERAGVKMLVFCHHAALFDPDAGNTLNIKAIRKFPDRFRAYCAVNPNYPETIKRDLKSFDKYRDVFVGFKFLSDYHQVALTDETNKPVFEFADRNELLVLIHTWGGSRYNGPEQVRKIAETYSKATLILGHSCHGEWEKAIALMKDFPNIYLELCAVVDERGILEKFVDNVGSEKILFGTDVPWFNHHYYIGAVLGSCISDDDCRNIFYRNARVLLQKFSF